MEWSGAETYSPLAFTRLVDWLEHSGPILLGASFLFGPEKLAAIPSLPLGCC